MPNYNVVFTTEMETQVTANSPEEAARSIEDISNESNEIKIEVLTVTELVPPRSNSYVSLKDFHSSQQPQVENNQSYSRLTPLDESPKYIRFISTIL